MEGGGLQAGPAQLVGHVVAGITRGDEDQHARPVAAFDHVAQQRRAPRGIDLDGMLLDLPLGGRLAGDLDAHRVVQQLGGQRLHRVREGGGEQQVLPAARQQRQHLRELVGEARVEQAVGLVEHQAVDVAELQRVLRDHVEQPARRRHDDVRAAAQRHHLRIDRHAAIQHRDLDRLAQEAPDLDQGLADLRGEFARGHEHQHLRAAQRRPHAGIEALQHREDIGGRLARAGGGAAQQVATGQDRCDGRGLDGGGPVEAQFVGGAQQRGRQPEVGEVAHRRLTFTDLPLTLPALSPRSAWSASSGAMAT